MAVDITSIKQAELSLSESEERFRAIFNGSDEAMFIKNKDFKYVDINTEAEKYLQKMKSEVIGKTDRELFGRKAADYTLKADTRVLKGEVIKEEIVKTYNKKLEFYSLTKLPLKGKDGRPIGICGIARNISQERNKEQELKVKSKINKDILDNAPFGIYVVNQAGGIDYVNKAMIDISAANYTRFMELNMLKHKQYIQYGLAKKIKSVLEGKSFRINGLEYTSYFGKKTTVRNFVGIPLTEEGSPKALIIIEDITELKRKEERLAKSAAEWTSTFDAMSDGISLHSANYEILNVNKAICKLLGKKKEQLIGQKCFSVFHRKTEPIGACPLARVVKTGKKELVEYFEPTLKIWLSVQISPILNKKGKVKKLIHVTRDISSRKKFEEELKNRNEELKKFNNIAVDRELKMIDLKRHIRELESEINWDKKI